MAHRGEALGTPPFLPFVLTGWRWRRAQLSRGLRRPRGAGARAAAELARGGLVSLFFSNSHPDHLFPICCTPILPISQKLIQEEVLFSLAHPFFPIYHAPLLFTCFPCTSPASSSSLGTRAKGRRGGGRFGGCGGAYTPRREPRGAARGAKKLSNEILRYGENGCATYGK